MAPDTRQAAAPGKTPGPRGPGGEQLPLVAPPPELPPCPACHRHGLRINGHLVLCWACPWVGVLTWDHDTPHVQDLRAVRTRTEVRP